MSRFVSKVYISKVLSLFGGEGLIVADPSYDYSVELHLAAAYRPLGKTRDCRGAGPRQVQRK
jgi:hypothetical protein